MLNTLIASLGESQGNVHSHVDSQTQKQKLDLIVDYLDMMPVKMQQDIEDTVEVIKLIAQPGAFKETQEATNESLNVEYYANTISKDLNDRIKING